MTTQTIAQLFNLTGKGALVTGGAMGIGQSIVSRLAEAGASVMIADINMEAANKTVKEIRAKGGKAQSIHADVRIAADAQKAIKATVEAFGHLDILVNNAGIYPYSPSLQMSEHMWDNVLNTNLKGMFFYSQAAAQEMIKAGHGGKIINVASVDSYHPYGNFAHYDASKGGVVMLTKSFALELAPHNILVNAVAPGGIKTPGFDQAAAILVQTSGISVKELEEGTRARVPLRRLGEPDDIAKVVLFLASGAADYLAGETVLADGGILLT